MTTVVTPPKYNKKAWNNQKHALLVAWNRAGTVALGDDEAGIAVGLPDSWRRASELRHEGLIRFQKAKGKFVTRMGLHGVPVRISEITPLGRRQLTKWNNS